MSLTPTEDLFTLLTDQPFSQKANLTTLTEQTEFIYYLTGVAQE